MNSILFSAIHYSSDDGPWYFCLSKKSLISFHETSDTKTHMILQKLVRNKKRNLTKINALIAPLQSVTN